MPGPVVLAISKQTTIQTVSDFLAKSIALSNRLTTSQSFAIPLTIVSASVKLRAATYNSVCG